MIILFLINYHQVPGNLCRDLSHCDRGQTPTDSLHRGQTTEVIKGQIDEVNLVNNEKMKLVYFSLQRLGL